METHLQCAGGFQFVDGNLFERVIFDKMVVYLHVIKRGSPVEFSKTLFRDSG